jgi:hypothetical protein
LMYFAKVWFVRHGHEYKNAIGFDDFLEFKLDGSLYPY